MIITPTAIPGAWIIDIEPHPDERGFFARVACCEEFGRFGLNCHMRQQSIAWNPRKGTLRGMHYQAHPYEEEKLVRVTRGAIHDVIVDLRHDSPAFGRWVASRLDVENRRQLYIPKGVAHGYQTLEDNTELFYQMSTPYLADAARGIRWDDPDLNIDWPPCEDRIISPRDQTLPLMNELR